jgi:transcriptional regulator GlxA family with amidase domain
MRELSPQTADRLDAVRLARARKTLQEAMRTVDEIEQEMGFTVKQNQAQSPVADYISDLGRKPATPVQAAAEKALTEHASGYNRSAAAYVADLLNGRIVK